MNKILGPFACMIRRRKILHNFGNLLGELHSNEYFNYSVYVNANNITKKILWTFFLSCDAVGCFLLCSLFPIFSRFSHDMVINLSPENVAIVP